MSVNTLSKESKDLCNQLHMLLKRRQDEALYNPTLRKNISAEIFHLVSGENAWLILRINKAVWLEICENVYENIHYYTEDFLPLKESK